MCQRGWDHVLAFLKPEISRGKHEVTGHLHFVMYLSSFFHLTSDLTACLWRVKGNVCVLPPLCAGHRRQVWCQGRRVLVRSPLPKSRSYLIEVHPQVFFSWIGKVDPQEWKWCWVRYGQESRFQMTWGPCSDENICILRLFITSYHLKCRLRRKAEIQRSKSMNRVEIAGLIFRKYFKIYRVVTASGNILLCQTRAIIKYDSSLQSSPIATFLYITNNT